MAQRTIGAFRWLASAFLGVLDVLTLGPQRRAVVRSVLFVTQVLPLPVKPQKWFSGEADREPVTFPVASGEGTADVYRIPDGKTRAGVLVFLGINPAPRDDHRVINLGKALARSGFVAMFAWSPAMMGKHIEATEPDNLVRAFQYLRGLNYVDSDRVGMGGFCVGASMLLIAASDPRINQKISFLSSFGAYYDIQDILGQVASNQSFYRETVEPWRPNHLTEEVFAIHLIEALEDARETEALSKVFIEKAGLDGLRLDTLSAEGNVVYRLLLPMIGEHDADRPELKEAQGLVGALSPRMIDGLKKISPSSSVSNLKAHLLIAHDREDDLVPAEESRRLADALAGRVRLLHTEFSFFSHVTPGKRVGPLTFVKEAVKLSRYTYSMVRVAS